jgi:hypothetical protein
VDARIDVLEVRLSQELAQHANAIIEAVRVQIAAVDEKYADIPGRVTALEQRVGGRKRR